MTYLCFSKSEASDNLWRATVTWWKVANDVLTVTCTSSTTEATAAVSKFIVSYAYGSQGQRRSNSNRLILIMWCTNSKGYRENSGVSTLSSSKLRYEHRQKEGRAEQQQQSLVLYLQLSAETLVVGGERCAFLFLPRCCRCRAAACWPAICWGWD